MRRARNPLHGLVERLVVRRPEGSPPDCGGLPCGTHTRTVHGPPWAVVICVSQILRRSIVIPPKGKYLPLALRLAGDEFFVALAGGLWFFLAAHRALGLISAGWKTGHRQAATQAGQAVEAVRSSSAQAMPPSWLRSSASASPQSSDREENKPFGAVTLCLGLGGR